MKEYNTRKINREDMLELTRRMTVKRNCFSRIAGAYIDEEGYVDGTFNRHFWNLSAKEQEENLAIAKTIPFAETNERVKEYKLSSKSEGPGSFYQTMMALRESRLKNDALLEVVYEFMAEELEKGSPYAIYFYYGNYDIPIKAQDKEQLEDSEEVYEFLLCAICPVHGDYEVDTPTTGFMFPAFSDRSADIHGVDVFAVDSNAEEVLLELIIE